MCVRVSVCSATQSIRLFPLEAAQSLLDHLIRYGPESSAARSVQAVIAARSNEEVLGLVGSVISPATLKKAYHQKCLEFHPDKNHARRAEEAFKRVQEAYRVLSTHGGDADGPRHSRLARATDGLRGARAPDWDTV